MTNLYKNKLFNIFRTYLLFTVFFGLVIGLGFAFGRIYNNPNILVFAVVFSTLMSLVSYWYSDKIVIAISRAKEVQEKDKPELYQIVKKLSSEANLPMPKVYVVPEMQPNAFATGRSAKHSVVAVTEGLLQKVTGSELTGVLAHELSHIGNRDMLINTFAVVLVGFISLLADFFMRSMLWGGFRSRDNDRNNSSFTFIIGMVLAILSPILATLLQLAISRRREFLADASGAILTKHPENLASALIKISKDSTPMLRANSTTAHLWLSDPFRGRKKTQLFLKLLMTHPPIEERVQALRDIKI